MSIFDRTRYIRALFVILPFGIMLSYFGIKSQFDLPKKHELQKISGVVLKTQVKKEYSKNYETYIDRERLYLVGHKRSYVFNKLRDYKMFQDRVMIGDSVDIWLNPNTDIKAIRQFAKENKIILEYKRIDIAGLIMGGFGLVALIISVLYIFKHPEDLKGGKE